MASNVIRLLGKDKGILWAHNGHIGRGIGYKIMGDVLREHLGTKAYAVGLFAQKGKYYAHWKNSVEEWTTEAMGIEAQFPAKGESWFAPATKFAGQQKAMEPENGGLITFVPSKRFDGLIVVTNLTPPRKR